LAKAPKDGTNWGSCPTAGFGITSVEMFGFIITILVNLIRKHFYLPIARSLITVLRKKNDQKRSVMRLSQR
jgi:hypothetical protein